MHLSDSRTAFWQAAWLAVVVLCGLPPQAFGALPTAIAISGSPNPATFGQPVTLTAKVTPATATGNVTFYDGVTVLGIKTIAAGKATLTTSLLPSGQRSIKAFYSGDAALAPATSALLAESVKALPGIGFGQPVKFPAVIDGNGNFVSYVAVADVNGDGKADLVTVIRPAGISVFLGNGDGTFQAKWAYHFPLAYFESVPSNVVVADFNGDGKPDLAAANGVAVSVLLGNGDGTFHFGRELDYAMGQPVSYLAAADFDGDGKVDLAVDLAVPTSGGSTLLLGNGRGSFQPGPSYLTGVTSGIAVGDFNGDGFADVAVVNYESGTVSIFLGTGQGTLQPAIDFATGVTYSRSIAVEDLNGDGKPDLAIDGSGKTVVLLGNGDGTFGMPVSSGPALPGGYFIGLGDVNGDGKPDLIFSPLGYLVLLFGNGDGTFSIPTIFNKWNTTYAGSVAIGDFNGDGPPDLVFTNGYVLMGGAGTGTSVTVSSSANPSYAGESVVFTANISPSDATGSVTFYDGSAAIGAVVLPGGAASLATSKMSPGSHSITAVYNGDTYHGAGVSDVLNQAVTPGAATTTSLSSPATQIIYGQSARLTATVSPSSADGGVAFYDGSTLIGIQPLVTGQAVFTANTPATGTQSFHAFYSRPHYINANLDLIFLGRDRDTCIQGPGHRAC